MIAEYCVYHMSLIIFAAYLGNQYFLVVGPHGMKEIRSFVLKKINSVTVLMEYSIK